MATFRDTPFTTTFALDDFRQFSERGSAVAVVIHCEKMQVIAVGSTPDGRSVAWLQPDIDTTKHFLAALTKEFGAPLAENTARELRLLPQPGKALPSRVVRSAIDMAETALVALEGARFLETLPVKTR